MTREDWLAQGAVLGARLSKVQWQIGDWLVLGQAQGFYSENDEDTLSDVLSALDISESRLKTLKWIAGVYPASQRVFDVSFAHYESVASLENRLEWLERAQENWWTREELRRRAFGKETSDSRRISVWLKPDEVTTLETMAALGGGQSVSEVAAVAIRKFLAEKQDAQLALV